jgi:hypothetical protein
MRSENVRENEKTPTALVEGAGRAAGLGVTPAERKERAVYTYIAICRTCGKVVKLGCVHSHPLVFVKLKETKSGERSVSFTGKVPDHLTAMIKEAWIEHKTDVSFIENLIDEWFYLAREGREEDLVIVNTNGVVGLVEGGDW